MASWLAAADPKEAGQEGVFAQVSAFADDDLHVVDGGLGDAWDKPAEEWTDEARSILAGKRVGRADKDAAHPNQGRNPKFKPALHRERKTDLPRAGNAK